MFNYLLYIFIQKGIPAMSCLDVVLHERECGLKKGNVELEGLTWLLL